MAKQVAFTILLSSLSLSSMVNKERIAQDCIRIANGRVFPACKLLQNHSPLCVLRTNELLAETSYNVPS
jgi:hypothetical protein